MVCANQYIELGARDQDAVFDLDGRNLNDVFLEQTEPRSLCIKNDELLVLVGCQEFSDIGRFSRIVDEIQRCNSRIA